MPTIHINVKNRVATANGDSRIINGNSDYNIEFDFDAEWAGLNNKIGIFAYNDAAAHKWAYQTVLFSGNTCAVPILRDIHCVYVGVKAGNVRVTTPAKVQCRLSISDYADTEEPPSADIWGQILAKLDELQTEIDEIKAGGGATPDWAQNDPNGAGYIKNRCGGYDDVQTKESELQSLNCPADKNLVRAHAGSSFFPPSVGDIVSVIVDGSTKNIQLQKELLMESLLWFGTQNPSSLTDIDAFLASDKWVGAFVPDENNHGALIIVVQYGSLSEIAGKTVGLKQRRLSVIPVKISRRYLDMPDWAKADSKPTYTANDVGAVPTDSVTTAVNAESTNENVPTAKAVYDALQDISGTDISLGVTATVGQTIKVKAVDADGKPTAWEAVDMVAGEVWETLAETTLEEESVPILDIGAMASSFSRLRFYFTFPIVKSVEKVYVSLTIPNSTTGPQYDVALINLGNDKSESWAFIDFYPLIYNGICYMSMIESAKKGITYGGTQQFQYNSYDYYRISEARYVRTSKTTANWRNDNYHGSTQMKICINGLVRDMTPDEVTAYQEAAITTQQQIPTAGLEDKMRVYIESIPTADTPTVPPKIGFKWKLIYRGIAGFAWELVPDPDAVGTVAKPFEWFAGIRVAAGYHYTNGADIALAVADGIPATFEDERFLAKL